MCRYGDVTECHHGVSRFSFLSNSYSSFWWTPNHFNWPISKWTTHKTIFSLISSQKHWWLIGSKPSTRSSLVQVWYLGGPDPSGVSLPEGPLQLAISLPHHWYGALVHLSKDSDICPSGSFQVLTSLVNKWSVTQVSITVTQRVVVDSNKTCVTALQPRL